MRLGRDMRGHDNARVVPERMPFRERLLAKDIEYHSRQLTAVERRNQIRLDEVPTASGIDERGAARQASEQTGVQDALGRRGQRQEADEDFAVREQRVEPVRIGIGHKSRDFLRAAAPAGHRKAERLQFAAGILAQSTETENADRPLAGVLLLAFLPRLDRKSTRL